MPRVLKPVRLSECIRKYVAALPDPGEFGALDLAKALGRDRQAVEYHLKKWAHDRVHVRKSGTRPGVWVRRTPKE